MTKDKLCFMLIHHIDQKKVEEYQDMIFSFKMRLVKSVILFYLNFDSLKINATNLRHEINNVTIFSKVLKIISAPHKSVSLRFLNGKI